MYYLMIDSETTNTIDDPFFYDLGLAVIDTKGNVYETASYVNADIFLNKELMESAYFKEKIPQYWEDIKNGNRILKSHYSIRKALWEIIAKYNINYIVAHNARFDYRSLNYTQRLITSSKYRYFLPYEIQILDTLKMSRIIIAKDENYIKFCNQNNYLTSKGGVRLTAEVIYKWLTNNINFTESHTGLEDVKIESKIFAYCMKFLNEEDGLLW